MADQRAALAVAMLAACAPALADDEEEAVTDMEFLEYLGSWDGSDEEWQLLEEAVMVESKDVPAEEKVEGSPETQDEG